MKINKPNIYFTLICFTISAFFFGYIFYKSEIFAEGTKHSYYLKYYIISVFFFIFSFITLFLKKETIYITSTISLSSLFAIYLIEYFLTIKFKEPPNEKLRYIQEFKKKDPKIVPMIYPADQMYRKDNNKITPLAGISKKKTIFCKEDGPLIEYQSDRYGFNNFDYIWDKQEIYAVTIGDSFTQGACVNTKNSIAYNINKKKSLLNLGIGGTGPLVHYAIVREYIDKASPKKIIWIYYEENDLGDLIYEKSQPVLRRYLQDESFSQKLILKQNDIDKKLIRILHQEIENQDKIKIKKIKNFFKLKFIRQMLFDKVSENQVSIPKDFSIILKRIKKLSKKKNIDLYFVYLPEKERYLKNLGNSEQYREYQKVIKIINDLEISLIDLNFEFQKNFENPLDLYNQNQLHLNTFGYKKAAELIYGKINELNK
ncbi:MAG: hypothetical protein ACJZ69_01660 [Pelagibacteraceae bacterium]